MTDQRVSLATILQVLIVCRSSRLCVIVKVSTKPDTFEIQYIAGLCHSPGGCPIEGIRVKVSGKAVWRTAAEVQKHVAEVGVLRTKYLIEYQGCCACVDVLVIGRSVDVADRPEVCFNVHRVCRLAYVDRRYGCRCGQCRRMGFCDSIRHVHHKSSLNCPSWLVGRRRRFPRRPSCVRTADKAHMSSRRFASTTVCIAYGILSVACNR